MWRLSLGLILGFTPPEPPPIQRPGDPVLWAFEWDAPPECPSRAEVIDGVRDYLPELDEPPPSPSRADLRVTVSLAVEGASWTATVRMSGRAGTTERRLAAPVCAEIGDAVALISAVALDPVLVARKLASANEAVEQPAPQSPPIMPPLGPPPPTFEPEPSEALHLHLEPSEAAPSATPQKLRFGLGVLATGAWGPTETGYAGLAGSLAVFAVRWRWQLEGGWSIPRTLALDDGRRGRIQAWRIGTRGCVVPRAGVLELPSCSGIEAGQVLARGLAPTTNASGERQLWAAAVIGQGLQWPIIDRLALTVEAAVVIAMVRGRFVIGDQTFASLTPVGFRAALGLEARF